MKRFLMIMIAILTSQQVYANESQDVRKTLQLLETGRQDQGSIVVINERKNLLYAAKSLGLQTIPERKMIVMTGSFALKMQTLLSRFNVNFEKSLGLSFQRPFLVLTDNSAVEFELILNRVYGAKAQMHLALTIFKGGLHDVLDAVHELALNTWDHAINVAHWSALMVYSAAEYTYNFAHFIYSSAGKIIVKTVKGTVVVAKFLNKQFCRIAKITANGTVAIAKFAVTTSFKIVNGTIEFFRNAVDFLFPEVNLGFYSYFELRIG